MIYSDVLGKNISLLGFGCMRLPCHTDGSINEEETAEMVKTAFENGVNYFDTAYPYHGGMSEVVIGKILKNYPRDSFYLASKFPGHQVASSYDPEVIFEEQLKKCQVDHFDFYLLHNVYENDIDVYEDPKWGILDYFKKQKELGRIRHLGFSSHATAETLDAFLSRHASEMDFCQIQLNYLDWTLQDAKKKVEILNKYQIPAWVMEPLRGGKLVKLSAENETKLKALRPDDSNQKWAFRFLQSVNGVKVILSGMSSLEQMKDNCSIFKERDELSPEEEKTLLEVAETLKNSVPCTACRYCCEGCPMGLNIPDLLAVYNEVKYFASNNATMRVEFLPEDKRPGACLACGACKAICPQKIDIPEKLKELSEIMASMKSWSDISKEREEAARKMREENR